MAAMQPFRFTLSLLLFVSSLIAGCGQPAFVRQESYVFGTRVEIVSVGAPEKVAQAALAEVLQEFDRIHHSYHAWQPSDLTRLNEACAQDQAITVSPEMAGLLTTARQFSLRSDGLFEPAIGSLIAEWGFHNDTFTPRLPDPERLRALVKANPRIAQMSIDGVQVRCHDKAIALDFGGIAKGWALDRAAAILRQRGVNNALINIGGNVMALGKKGDVPWQVGIQEPRGSGALATLSLYDGEAIGTSGDYQRFFELDGKRYSHLIDPRTGRPATGTEAVTVLITPRPDAGMLSDVVSKPIFLGGAEKWRDMARRMNVAHVLRVDDSGHIQMTREMQSRLRWGDGKSTAEVVN